MKVRSTPVVAAAVALVALSGVATVVTMGATAATLSDTRHSTPSEAGAASVVLGREGGALDLGFEGLAPGIPQTVELTVDYRGTVDAELSLSIAPEGDAALCGARPAVPLEMTVGDTAPVDYCDLYDGRRIPLGRARPGSVVTVPVVVALGRDAAIAAADLREVDAVVVHAEGGFVDSAPGRLTLITAAGPEPATGAAAPAEQAVEGIPAPGVPVVAPVAAADALVVDTADPATTARNATEGTPIALPEECVEAGVEPESIVRIVALDATDPNWDGTREAGPVLVLGTAGADTVIGSSGGDCIVGGAGDDVLAGGSGDDVLVGDAGADRSTGDAGDDLLLGSAGVDHLRGGDGRDSFDGGVDEAACDAVAPERTVRCLPPVLPGPLVATPPPTTGGDSATPPPAAVAPAEVTPAESAPAEPASPAPPSTETAMPNAAPAITTTAAIAPSERAASPSGDEAAAVPDESAESEVPAADPTTERAL